MPGVQLPATGRLPSERNLATISGPMHAVRIKQRHDEVRNRARRGERRARLLSFQAFITVIESGDVDGNCFRWLCPVACFEIEHILVPSPRASKPVDGSQQTAGTWKNRSDDVQPTFRSLRSTRCLGRGNPEGLVLTQTPEQPPAW